METQIKFLNKKYLDIRLNEHKEIKSKEVFYVIEESDRAFSKSLYINFYCHSYNEKKFKGHTLRISDHLLNDCPHSQFIIEPEMPMTKNKKEQFVKAIKTAIRKAKSKHFYRELNNISVGEMNDE